jgi:PIN domain nuclease of toxin-antitoxin system
MRLLLDTFALLWFMGNDSQLSAPARRSIENLAHEKFVSAASLWEIAAKLGLEKLKLPRPFDRLLIAQALADGMTIVTRNPEFSRYPATVLW